MTQRGAFLAGAGAAAVTALVWFGLTQLVSSSCDYDCTDKGARFAFLAILVVVALLLPAITLLLTLRPMPGHLPRILLGGSVLVSTACVLVAVGLTILVIAGGAELIVALVACVLWIGAGLASLAVRRLNEITGA